MNKVTGRAGENTKSSCLSGLLRERGFPDADFEHIFGHYRQITRRRTQRKPDVVFLNGGLRQGALAGI
jgi:hypothetical protein